MITLKILSLLTWVPTFMILPASYMFLDLLTIYFKWISLIAEPCFPECSLPLEDDVMADVEEPEEAQSCEFSVGAETWQQEKRS